MNISFCQSKHPPPPPISWDCLEHARFQVLLYILDRPVLRFETLSKTTIAMRHVRISHNAPYLPIKIFIMCYLCFSFTGSWVLQSSQGILKTVLMQFFFFRGGDKVHYGKCESSVLCIIRKEARKVNLFLTKKNISIKVNEITWLPSW